MDFEALNQVEDIEINTLSSSEIEISILTPNPYQPRLRDEDINTLAQSISEHGLLQPIAVNQDNIIIGGHRRYYAHIKLGLEKIKYTRVETTKQELYSLALVENTERESLDCIELALSYKKALDEKIFSSAKELAISLNKSESHVTKVKNALRLPQEVQEDIIKHKRKVSIETLNLLLRLRDSDSVINLYYSYIRNELNRQSLKEEINKILHKPSPLDDDYVKTTNTQLKVSFPFKHLDDEAKEKLEQEINQLLSKYEKGTT